jgi:hypothetical protein
MTTLARFVDKILAYRVIADIRETKPTSQDNLEINYDNLFSEFENFLNSETVNLKYDVKDYSEVLSEVESR